MLVARCTGCEEWVRLVKGFGDWWETDCDHDEIVVSDDECVINCECHRKHAWQDMGLESVNTGGMTLMRAKCPADGEVIVCAWR